MLPNLADELQHTLECGGSVPIPLSSGNGTGQKRAQFGAEMLIPKEKARLRQTHWINDDIKHCGLVRPMPPNAASGNVRHKVQREPPAGLEACSFEELKLEQPPRWRF